MILHYVQGHCFSFGQKTVICCLLIVQYTSNTKCVFTVRVGRSSDGFKVQLEMDAGHHMGLPPHLIIQGTDINTDLYSFPRCELQRGERREKGQKGQERTERIRSPRLLWLLFVLCCFWFCNICSGKQRQFETKGPFSKQ